MKRNNKGQFVRGGSEETFEGYGIWYDYKGYPSIWINGKSFKLHVFIWERENGPKPAGHDLHHIDFNKSHYNPSNLELVTHSNHQKIHAGWIRENGIWTKKPCTACGLVLPLCDFYPRKGFCPTPKCKKCHCKQTEQWTEKNREKRRIIALNYWRRKTGREVMPYAKEQTAIA